MLNRRLIRIRAMQALFAYKQAEGANFQLGMDLIAEKFAPNLNSMEYQDREKLEGLKKLAQQLFQESFSRNVEKDDFLPPKEVEIAVDKAREMYLLRNKKDVEHYGNRSIAEAEKVYELYLKILQIYIEVADRATNDSPKLANNQVVKLLKSDKILENQALKRNATWRSEQVLMAKFYREAVRENKTYQEYIAQNTHSLEEDTSILKYLLKNVILRHELMIEYFDRDDLYFIDDIDTLRAMVSHTIESPKVTGKLKIELLEDDWEQNKEFLQTLYRKTITEQSMLESYMIPNLKNWDYERIAVMDRILIMLALTEMIHYPSIPVKVTINEIIEIAKDYSTPKSGNFINGILDLLSKELTKSGVIRKSGRGMLDNR